MVAPRTAPAAGQHGSDALQFDIPLVEPPWHPTCVYARMHVLLKCLWSRQQSQLVTTVKLLRP
jgi:hypothetical protein